MDVVMCMYGNRKACQIEWKVSGEKKYFSALALKNLQKPKYEVFQAKTCKATIFDLSSTIAT
jgi:hypothetical protein